MRKDSTIVVLDHEAEKAWHEKKFGKIPLIFLRSIVQRRYDDGELEGVRIPGRSNQIAVGVDISTLESIAKENKERSRNAGHTLNELRRLVENDH